MYFCLLSYKMLICQNKHTNYVVLRELMHWKKMCYFVLKMPCKFPEPSIDWCHLSARWLEEYKSDVFFYRRICILTQGSLRQQQSLKILMQEKSSCLYWYQTFDLWGVLYWHDSLPSRTELLTPLVLLSPNVVVFLFSMWSFLYNSHCHQWKDHA